MRRELFGFIRNIAFGKNSPVMSMTAVDMSVCSSRIRIRIYTAAFMQPRLDNGRRPHAVYHQHDVVAYQDCRNEEFGMGVESVYHTGYQPSALVVDFRTHAVGGHKGYFRTGKQCGKYERYCRYGYPGEHDGFCLLVLVVLVGLWT